MGRMVGSIQLFKSLCPIPSPEPTIPSVQATFSQHSQQSLLVLLMGRMVGSIQLFKSLCPIPSPEPTIPSVQATFSAKPSSLTNGEDGR